MEGKAPRRTAQRILDVALDLCNRLGTTQVSTTRIAAEMRISPGNLYYHYNSKDALIAALLNRHQLALQEQLKSCDLVRDLPQTALFLQQLQRLIWRFRFLYRDLNHLLTDTPPLAPQVQAVLGLQKAALLDILQGLARNHVVMLRAPEHEIVASGWMMVLMYGLSYTYASTTRPVWEPQEEAQAVEQGVQHMLQLLTPYLLQRGQEEFSALLVGPLVGPLSGSGARSSGHTRAQAGQEGAVKGAAGGAASAAVDSRDQLPVT